MVTTCTVQYILTEIIRIIIRKIAADMGCLSSVASVNNT
jgi:hypothetical protein